MVHFVMFDTKFAIVLRDDLAVWQKLNVTAFLTSGIVAQFPDIIGELYRDRAGNLYNPLSIQPVIVLSADGPTLNAVHRRALERGQHRLVCRQHDDRLDRQRIVEIA